MVQVEIDLTHGWLCVSKATSWFQIVQQQKAVKIGCLINTAFQIQLAPLRRGEGARARPCRLHSSLFQRLWASHHHIYIVYWYTTSSRLFQRLWASHHHIRSHSVLVHNLVSSVFKKAPLNNQRLNRVYSTCTGYSMFILPRLSPPLLESISQ